MENQDHVYNFVESSTGSAVIKVLGVGGGGCNAINNMIDNPITGVEYISANTDAQSSMLYPHGVIQEAPSSTLCLASSQNSYIATTYLTLHSGSSTISPLTKNSNTLLIK